MRTHRTYTLCATFVVLAFSLAHGQVANPSPNAGVAPLQTYLGENENINLATGNVNIQIPFFKLPGRNGHDVVEKMSYNSQRWFQSTITDGQGVIHNVWMANSAWTIGRSSDYLLSSDLGPLGSNTPINCLHNYRVYITDGRTISFPGIQTACYDLTIPSHPVAAPQYDNYISSPTGSSPDPWIMTVDATSGNTTLKLDSGETIPFSGSSGWDTKDEDANGNMITALDTVGRSLPAGSTQGNTSSTITATDSNGNPQTVTLTCLGPLTTLVLPFNAGGYSNPGISLYLTSTVTLPNNDVYTLTFGSDFGELTHIAYPSGGYTTYVYGFPSTTSYVREILQKRVCRSSNGCPGGTGEEITNFTPVVAFTTNTSSTVVSPTGDQVVYSFSGNYETQRAVYSGTTTLLRTITRTSFLNPSLPTKEIVTLNDTGQQSMTQWDYDTTPYYQYPSPTNNIAIPFVTAKREYDWGQGSPGPLLRQTITNWLHVNPVNSQDYGSTTIHIFDRKAKEVVQDGFGNRVAETDYEYDNYATAMTGSGATQLDTAYHYNANPLITTRGNLTSSKRWLNTTGTFLPPTVNTYDDAGNVLTTTDPGGHQTQFSYTDNFVTADGSGHNAEAWVTKTTLPAVNGVVHIEQKQYFFNTGLPAASCGQNFSGTCTNTATLPQPDYAKFTYDGMNRPLNTTSGDSGVTSTTYSDDTNTLPPLSQSSSQSITSALNLTNTSILNGLGDVLQTQFTSDPDGVDYVDTTYDAAGRKKTVSNPHRTAASSTDGITTFNYDGLSRSTSVVKQDGSTVSTSYSGNSVTVTDEAGKQRRSVTDGLGRLIEVDEPGNVTAGTAGAPATRATATVTISGTERTAQGPPFQCGPMGQQTCHATIPDIGTVTVTVNGFQAQVGYASTSDTSSTIATALTNILNGGTLPVTATVSGSVITLTAVDAGAGGNFPLSVSSVTTNTAWFTAGTTSFPITDSGANLTGGADAGAPGAGTGTSGSPLLSTPAVTLYKYDTLDNLICVEQHGSAVSGTGCASAPSNDASSPWRIRRFSYDSLSRLLTAKNPESGTISYTYDNDSNVLSKVAPKPNQTGALTVTTTYTYDALHRLTQKSYNDGSTATVQYGYDGVALAGCTTAPPALTDTYPKGRRTAMCDASGASSWNHEVMGRTAFEKRTILGTSAVTNTIGYTYNLDGSVATLTYPNTGKVITYLPGGAGRTLTAQDIAGSINYVQNAHYAPFGGLTSMTNGAQPITTTNTYNSRLQPVTLSAATSAATILSLSYDFHAGAGDNGNVFQIVNNRDNNRTQNFTYDALNRIQQGNSTGANWGEAFTIDAWGNLTNRSAVTGKTNFEGLSVTALVSNRLSGFGYDAAGNMTSNGSATYTYDAENRLLTTAGVTYAYDGGGKRVKKSSGTLYWTGMGSDNLSESDLTGVIQKEYIFFNSKRVARRDVPGTPSVKYYFSDHLGSASIVTDTIGTMIACPTNSSLITGEDESDYYPYGGEMQLCNRVSQDYKFTGKQRDGESGLDNFGARYDASSLGRFMTPDWSAGADPIPFVVPGQPQSLNLYSYVMNDPILVADADGHFCMDSFGICDSNSGPGSLSAAMVAAVSNVHSGFASVNSALDDDSRFSPFMWEFWTPPMVPGNVKEAMGDSVDASNKKGGLNGSDHKGGFHEEGGYAFPSCSGNCSSLTVVPSLPGAYSDPSVDASATMGFTAADPAKMQLMMDAGQSPDIFWHVHPKGKKGGHDFAQGPSDQDKDIAAGRVNIVVGARNMRVYFYDNNGAVHSMSWKQFMKDRY